MKPRFQILILGSFNVLGSVSVQYVLHSSFSLHKVQLFNILPCGSLPLVCPFCRYKH